jgi:acetamidase/formamidase
MDLEVRYKDQIYIIEMKTAQGARAALKAARAGMAQIFNNNYGGAYQNPILVSMAVDLEIRSVGARVFVKNGETTVLNSQASRRLK